MPFNKLIDVLQVVTVQSGLFVTHDNLMILIISFNLMILITLFLFDFNDSLKLFITKEFLKFPLFLQ